MTEEQRRGRTILATYIATLLAMSAIVIGLYVSVRGMDHLPSRVVRFTITTALLLWLYGGSNVARGLCIVLYCIAAMVAAQGLFRGGEIVSLGFLGSMGVTHLSFAVILIASPSVSAFLEYQRRPLQNNWETATSSDGGFSLVEGQDNDAT